MPDRPSQASAPIQSPLRVLWLLVLLILGAYVALTVWLAVSSIFFPYQLDYGEGIVLWFTQQLAHGAPIYHALPDPPFVTANYPPVALLFAALFYPLFGDSYIMGRWLNLAAALVIAAFIFRFVRDQRIDEITSSRRARQGAALLSALLFFGSTFIYHWVPLFRVDLIGLAFTIPGVFFVWRWEKDQGRRTKDERRATDDGRRTTDDERRTPFVLRHWSFVILALLFFLLALYTKHTLIAAPMAAILALLIKDRRAGIVFALALGLIGGAIYVAMEVATGGGWSFGLLAANATVWSLPIFLKLVTNFGLTYGVLLVLAAWAWWSRVRARQIGVLEIYGFAALLGTALAGREGAWENYFLEAVTMVCVFAGFSIARLMNTPMRWRWALPALLLVQLALFWNEHDPRLAQQLFDQARMGNAQVAPLVRAASGPIISEDMGLLVTNGKPIEYYTFPYSTLARAGRWDQHWEIENLRAGRFPLVILLQGTREDVDHFGNFTRDFVSALDYGYAVKTQDGRYVVYEPAPLAHLDPNAVFGDALELVGWSLAPERLELFPEGKRGDSSQRTGQMLTLTVVWRALKPLSARYTTFAHLEDANGGNVAQDDHEPHGGQYPTTRWVQGEMVRETYTLHVPPNLPVGDYFLRVGWYETLTQERLSTVDGADFVELKKFEN